MYKVFQNFSPKTKSSEVNNIKYLKILKFKITFLN